MALNVFNTLKGSFFKESTMTDTTTMEVISRIKFIGRIQKGQKINTRGLYLEQDGWFTRFSRTLLNYDNRANALNFIETTINRCFEIISLNFNSQKISERCLVLNLVSDLKVALQGTSNLKETYMNDHFFCCELDALVQRTTARLVELEEEMKTTLDLLKQNENGNYNEDDTNIDAGSVD